MNPAPPFRRSLLMLAAGAAAFTAAAASAQIATVPNTGSDPAQLQNYVLCPTYPQSTLQGNEGTHLTIAGTAQGSQVWPGSLVSVYCSLPQFSLRWHTCTAQRAPSWFVFGLPAPHYVLPASVLGSADAIVAVDPLFMRQSLATRTCPPETGPGFCEVTSFVIPNVQSATGMTIRVQALHVWQSVRGYSVPHASLSEALSITIQ